MGLYVKTPLANPDESHFGILGKVVTLTKKFTFIS